MPLIKSKSDKAFKSNIKAEMAAGKPQKQAVAIAYSTKRAAKKAVGGRMSTDPRNYDNPTELSEAKSYNFARRIPRNDQNVNESDAAAMRAVERKVKPEYKGMTVQQRINAMLKKNPTNPKKSGGKVNSCW